ncbi:MAG TPA: ABC transporter permease [Longimicrobiales bacterium]
MRSDRERELDEELATHLRMAVAERMARGESREAAEAAARREFGNLTHVKEVTREQWGGVWLERLVQDVRYGVRALRRTPAFALAAVLTLALAIGATSAVFTVVNGVLLRPLPFPDPDRLFVVSYLPTDLPFDLPPGMADSQWLTYRDRQRSFEPVTAYASSAANLSGAGEATRLFGARADASFFRVLGVAPLLGRVFTATEVAGDEHVVVLGETLWRQRFGANPHVLGSWVELDGVPHVVIGVMPRGFTFPEQSSIWMPLNVRLDAHNFLILGSLGRLRPGVTAVQARAELESIMGALPHAGRGRLKTVARIVALKETVTGNVQASLFVFLGAVAFVLLIACANIANLLLIRAASRRREMAVRVALGAGRGRIARQLLTESILIALAGGALGIPLAALGVRALVAIAPAGRIPRLGEVHLDWRVVAFTMAIAVLTGLLFGLLPAVHSARRPPQEAMSESTRLAGGSHGRLRGGLAVGEIALALVLLTGAGLMIRSFLTLRAADKGYDGTRVTTMDVNLPSAKYADAQRQKAFHAELLGSLSRIAGVRGAALVSTRPMANVGMMGNFTVEGPSPLPRGYEVDKMLVSPGYFAAMGVRLMRGRDFTAADDARAPGVLIVSQSVASKLWPGQDPLGRRVSEDEQPSPGSWRTVVGVVSDVVQDRSMAKRSGMYFPYQQSSWTWSLANMTYVVRTDAGAGVAPAMRSALRAVDPAIPALQLMSMDDALMEVVAEPVFQTRLLAVFAALALLLAAIGTYGVLAYDVTERSREIALRMALGATPGEVIRLVMRRTGSLALGGAAIGLLGSVALTRLLTGSLYQVKPTDPATMAAVAATMIAVALLSGFAPARRASRVQVMAALARD